MSTRAALSLVLLLFVCTSLFVVSFKARPTQPNQLLVVANKRIMVLEETIEQQHELIEMQQASLKQQQDALDALQDEVNDLRRATHPKQPAF